MAKGSGTSERRLVSEDSGELHGINGARPSAVDEGSSDFGSDRLSCGTLRRHRLSRFCDHLADLSALIFHCVRQSAPASDTGPRESKLVELEEIEQVFGGLLCRQRRVPERQTRVNTSTLAGTVRPVSAAWALASKEGRSESPGEARRLSLTLPTRSHDLATGLVAHAAQVGELTRGLSRQFLRGENAEPIQSILSASTQAYLRKQCVGPKAAERQFLGIKVREATVAHRCTIKNILPKSTTALPVALSCRGSWVALETALEEIIQILAHRCIERFGIDRDIGIGRIEAHFDHRPKAGISKLPSRRGLLLLNSVPQRCPTGCEVGERALSTAVFRHECFQAERLTGRSRIFLDAASYRIL